MTIRPTQKLVTYVARNLEPCRGFHIFMRALPRILAREDAVVSVVGGDGISYGAPPALRGTWRMAMQRELGDGLDPARVHFLGKAPDAQHLALLQRSMHMCIFFLPLCRFLVAARWRWLATI